MAQVIFKVMLGAQEPAGFIWQELILAAVLME